MKKFYESLIDIKDDGERDQIITEYLRNAGIKHKENIQKYQLWIKYLKRSEKFIEACEWFEKAKKQYPYPSEFKQYKHKLGYLEDYYIFAAEYSEKYSRDPLYTLSFMSKSLKILRAGLKGSIDSFFSWAIDSDFPANFEDEMLMNLFVFGNIHKDPVDAYLLRIIHIIESQGKRNVFDLNEIIDRIFGLVEYDDELLDKRELSLQEFKTELKKFFKSEDFFSFFCMIDPYENKEKIFDSFGKLIDRKRRILEDSDFKEDLPKLRDVKFEYPQENIRIDDLERYLEAYDLQKDGKSIQQIGQIMHPDSSSAAASVDRVVLRDLQKARKIIKNVEIGFFPGNYQ